MISTRFPFIIHTRGTIFYVVSVVCVARVVSSLLVKPSISALYLIQSLRAIMRVCALNILYIFQYLNLGLGVTKCFHIFCANHSLTFRHRASCIYDRRFVTLQRTIFIYLINKHISLSDICLTVHH